MNTKGSTIAASAISAPSVLLSWRAIRWMFMQFMAPLQLVILSEPKDLWI
jgi:hypothetical protein